MYDDIPCNSTTMLDFFQYPGSNDMAIAITRYRTLFGAFQSKNTVFDIHMFPSFSENKDVQEP